MFGLLRRRRAAGRRRSAARDEGCCQGRTRTIVRVIKTQPGSHQGRNFFLPGAAGFPWGLTRTIVRLVSQAARRSPNPPRRCWVQPGVYMYISRKPEQIFVLTPIPKPESRIPMITRTIHRFIFLAACCAPNLPSQRPDNPNNLSGYARGLRFSERESPR